MAACTLLTRIQYGYLWWAFIAAPQWGLSRLLHKPSMDLKRLKWKKKHKQFFLILMKNADKVISYFPAVLYIKPVMSFYKSLEEPINGVPKKTESPKNYNIIVNYNLNNASNSKRQRLESCYKFKFNIVFLNNLRNQRDLCIILWFLFPCSVNLLS